jgi:hypothetical protein
MVERNQLLNRLDPVSMARLAPHLSVLHLAQGEVLAETHQPISRSIFPRTASYHASSSWKMAVLLKPA